MKPVIGITPEAITIGRQDGAGLFLGHAYTRAIEHAGGIPVILPLTADQSVLEHFLDACQGFVLSGGGDMTEASGAYAARLPATILATLTGLDATRDTMELELARAAVRRDRPLLGICRGIQTLNVALGGTLHADVPNHRHADPFALAHSVIWEIDGDWPVRVNTTHHQALDRVAAGLRVTARANDGIIEAVDLPGARYCVGVQFHPERLAETVPQCAKFFTALVQATQ
jgi:putative glutamine amidotransferase